ncbi:MAG TPA: DNA primase [Streptosporangiaceae bacterium]
MAGRIRDEDIALVREKSAIDEVVGEYLQLRNAGGGSLKGLCPFHDEKTPSFNVTPARGLWYCFSCAEGGDVIKFVEKIDNLSFVESVERLAARAGIDLRYEQGGQVPGREHSQRRRLLEAHKAAAEFYAERLSTPDAAPGRAFLAERGFALADAGHFGVGYAPAEWEGLTRHLRGRGFTEQELLAGGLASQGRRGAMDRFRGRLMWPIRDLTGDVIAFGARKLNPDEDGPKYLNTPETPLFRKSTVLYGADLAKREIAQRRQAVIVEGYTDVMACHLAGVRTAVATSGTSFGDGHIKILRRLLMDADQFRGEVIFTFDGDAAGQRAALRAFDLEEHFVTQTFVAVQPDGLDPCDLRLKQGDGAVRDLIAQRLPVFEFAIRSELAKHNLDTNEGRLAALDAAARIIGRIKDRGLRDRYAVSLDRWLGMLNEEFVLARVREHGVSVDARRRGGPDRGPGAPARGDSPGQGAGLARGPGPARGSGPAGGSGPGGEAPRAAAGRGGPDGSPYDASDPVVNLERQALKLAIQRPALCGPVFDTLQKDDFSVPVHGSVRELIAGCGGVAAAGTAREWAARLIGAAPNDRAREFVTRLAVEPVETPRADGEPDARYAEEVLARVAELAVSRQITTLKSRLQRLNPTDSQSDYNRTFGDLVALEQRRKALLERASGAL